MPLIQLKNVHASLSFQPDQAFHLKNINWHVALDQHWVLLGKNGAGKSALSALLVGNAKIIEGQRTEDDVSYQIVSSQTQKELINEELLCNQDDILDGKTKARTVQDIIAQHSADNPLFDHTLCQRLIDDFDFEPLLTKQFRALSTGETRKLMLIKALSSNAQLVILDEPFDGLDSSMTEKLNAFLTELSARTCMVFVLNRLDEIPAFISHFGYVDNGQLVHQLSHPDAQQRADLFKLMHLQQTTLTIPSKDSSHSAPVFTNKTLVKLTQAHVKYADKSIFSQLDWTINKGEHWQLSGKNGSGKTCLLNLITGDNPQCYNNDIEVFGFKRGSGESIWDIKQHIGYISNALHMDYRVSISALNTVISGFYDSIGLYQQATQKQIDLATQWLELLGLSKLKSSSFSTLSYGDQRMLLIARAMVKHPTLLILDEPCLGLDEANRQRVLLLIEKICAAGSSTVIYVNHHAKDKIAGIEHYLDMADFKA